MKVDTLKIEVSLSNKIKEGILVDIIEGYNLARDSLKENILSYTQDKSIDVMERYMFWRDEVPQDFKEHSRWIYHWFNADVDDKFSCHSDPFYIEKYQTVQTVECIDHMIENGLETEILEEEIEEILQSNLGSYVMDW